MVEMNEDEQNAEPTWGAAYGAGESHQPTEQSQVPPIGAGSSQPYPPTSPVSDWTQPAPPPAWQPPPSSWQPAPLAPSAWQPTGPQPPRKRGIQPFVLIGLAVALVLGVVGAVVVIRQNTDDPGQPVAGQLRGTFPSKPSVGWRLDAADVFERAEFVRPDPTSNQYFRPGFIDLGDTLITAAYLPQSDRGADLVAIDAATGDILWNTDQAGFRPNCATAVVDGLLPCVGHDPSWGSGRTSYSVRFVRVSDGEIDHEIEVDEHTTRVEVHNSSVYTFGYDPAAEADVITRGTTENLSADWEESYSSSGGSDRCGGSGDSVIYGATDDVVYMGSDIGVLVANAADGARLTDEDVQHLTLYPGQGFLGRVCDGSDSYNADTVVFDLQGNELNSISSPLVAGVVPADTWLVSPGTEQPYVVDRAAYEFVTGDELWDAGSAIDTPPMRTVIGDTVLAGGREGEGMAEPYPLVAFDLHSGEELWSEEVVGDPILSDGQRVLMADGDTFTSVNLATGRQEWTLGGMTQNTVAPAGDGFAAAAPTEITFYGPSGGPSVAPGRIATDESDSESGGFITRCGTPPTMRPVEYRTDDGGLLVRMEVTASCPDGDIVSTDAMAVSISDDQGAIASGVFDFSGDPLYLPGTESGAGTVETELKFGLGSFWRLPNSLGESGSSSSSSGSVAAAGDQLVECTDEGTSSGPDSVEDPPISTDVKTVVATGSAAVDNRDPQTIALDALRAQANADKPFILSDLAERWVPQVSSKQPGLVATDVDGVTMVTWTPQEILNQHLRLRLRYPEVRLLWSDEWSSFNIRSWWVTVAGLTFDGPDAANAWCDSNAIPVNECFAKLVSNTRGPEGTTKYRS